jgi:Flp pilus assembly protein CpaB
MPKTTEPNRRSRVNICSGVRHETQDKDKETEEVLNNARVVAKIQKSDVNSESSCGSVWDWDWDWFRLRLRLRLV